MWYFYKRNSGRIPDEGASFRQFVPLAILYLLVFPYSLLSQYNTNFLNYSKTGRCVSVNLDYEAGSNGVTAEMMNRLIYGGYVDNDLKKRASRLMQERNNFGVYLNYDVSAFIKGNSRFDFLVGFKNQEVLNATYSRDFYKLMFYGNQMFKGATADLSHCNVNALRFQEFKFGAILHHVDSLGKIGISLSLLNGEQLFYINTKKNSNLYTADDGSELVFNSNFNMAISDTNNKKVAGFNGIGAGADIFFETPYTGRLGKRSMLTVNANNIGFIHWWHNSVQYSSDSSLRFSGYRINSINDLKDSTLNRINNDSLLRQLSNARNEDFNVNIPTNLVIVNKVFFGGVRQFCLSLGYRYIFNANYKSYVFLEPEIRYKAFIFGLHVGYGGYMRLNAGAAITYDTRAWFLRFGSNSLQGYLVPQKSYGQGLFFTLAKKFK
jgi:hypothetical protein